MSQASAEVQTIETGGMTVAYREEGTGDPVLLIHGWPTSSYLWRESISAIARTGRRAIAIDLPGFGGSSKPADTRYDAPLFERAIDGLLDALGAERVGLAVHDLGGPVGVHWALENPERVTKLAILNTLLYPELHPMVIEFVQQLADPESARRVTSPEGLAEGMRFGLSDESKLTPEVLAAVTAPFESGDARAALARAGIEYDLARFSRIAEGLPGIEVPVLCLYGPEDRVLPDIADTVARIQRDIPHAEARAVESAGHFLQEDAPGEVAEALAEFFSTA